MVWRMQRDYCTIDWVHVKDCVHRGYAVESERVLERDGLQS